MVLTERLAVEKLLYASNMLKVIAHPTRLSIVDLLHTYGRLTVSDIQERLGLDQPIASQQLILMQDKGVLVSAKEGRNRYFSLKHPEMYNIISCLESCCNNL